jgi:GDP-L-fucose synthase
MQDYDDGDHINIGTGEDVSIKELAEIISKIINFRENIEWDTSKPNGTPRKLLNVDKIKALGWEPKINLNDGITSTYKWYKKSI